MNTGFEEEDIQQKALDGNSCVEFNAEYSTHFDVEPAMRAAMKLELNYTALSLPSIEMDMGYLFDELSGKKSQTFQMQCVDIREALAEKLVSFPRRLAMHLTDTKRFKFDKALARVMVYGNDLPSFDDAFSSFDDALIALLPHANTNFNHDAAKLGPVRSKL